MPRENAETKARRYLAEGRLTVVERVPGMVRATCRGSDAVYQVGGPDDAWSCDCPARVRCAHLIALGKVVIRRKPVPSRHMLAPGSAEAIAAGCRCDRGMNEDGLGMEMPFAVDGRNVSLERGYYIADGCPVHAPEAA